MKIIFALLISLFGSATLAQTIVCPSVGTMIVNGDTIDMTYNSGFKFRNDIAYFFSTSNQNSYYRLTNWSAEVQIPNALLDRRVPSADVTFTGAGGEALLDTCSVQ